MKYERLTEKLDIIEQHIERNIPVKALTNGELTELELLRDIAYMTRDLLHKIEQGKLIELPCKVGDTVYHLYGGTLNKDTVFRYEFENGTTPLVYFENHLWQGKKPTKKNLIDNYRRFRPIADFGVYWFTDYKLAEAKLKELENE